MSEHKISKELSEWFQSATQEEIDAALSKACSATANPTPKRDLVERVIEADEEYKSIDLSHAQHNKHLNLFAASAPTLAKRLRMSDELLGTILRGFKPGEWTHGLENLRDIIGGSRDDD